MRSQCKMGTTLLLHLSELQCFVLQHQLSFHQQIATQTILTHHLRLHHQYHPKLDPRTRVMLMHSHVT